MKYYAVGSNNLQGLLPITGCEKVYLGQYDVVVYVAAMNRQYIDLEFPAFKDVINTVNPDLTNRKAIYFALHKGKIEGFVTATEDLGLRHKEPLSKVYSTIAEKNGV